MIVLPGPPGKAAFGNLIASLDAPVTVLANETKTLHTIDFPAGSSKRLILVCSADSSPNDGTTSGYLISVMSRIRRQAGGTYSIDIQSYLMNLEQNSAADAGFTGGATLIARFNGIAGSTIQVNRADLYEV